MEPSRPMINQQSDIGLQWLADSGAGDTEICQIHKVKLT